MLELCAGFGELGRAWGRCRGADAEVGAEERAGGVEEGEDVAGERERERFSTTDIVFLRTFRGKGNGWVKAVVVRVRGGRR